MYKRDEEICERYLAGMETNKLAYDFGLSDGR